MTEKKIIIIGGGIVGSTAAFYLSQDTELQITLIDDGAGNATRAAAGIICPWLSQRRNKDWYQLVDKGANFYLTLMQDLEKAGITKLPYKQTGTLIFKNKEHLLRKLSQIAEERREASPMIGKLDVYPDKNLQSIIPQLQTDQGAILAQGGGRVDGGQLLDQLQEIFVKRGGRLIKGQARLIDKQGVEIGQDRFYYDHLILAAGAWLPHLLQPLGYTVDVAPQKGQLLEIQTPFETDNWPGCMLHGEIDILPFADGKLVIGATHENDMDYDLTIEKEKIQAMKTTAQEFIPDLDDYPVSKTRVGTRAYTSDFLPFYGSLPDNPAILVASGLGSSGLTCGPFIGWQLTQMILEKPLELDAQTYSPASYITR